jgi:hypothetical protein
MSSNRQSWYPPVDPNMTPEEMALHLRLIYTALNDHDQAIVSVSQKTGTVTNNTTVVQSGGGGGGGGGIPSLGGVNDQIGATTYTTQQSDNGAKILMGDSSPVTVTLNGAVTTPWFTFIGNDSSSTVSLVASHGTLKGQNYIEPGLFGIIFFDGANFWSEGTPIAHDSSLGIVRPDNTSIKVDSTGVLSASALSFSQISGGRVSSATPGCNHVGAGRSEAGRDFNHHRFGGYQRNTPGVWNPSGVVLFRKSHGQHRADRYLRIYDSIHWPVHDLHGRKDRDGCVVEFHESIPSSYLHQRD